MDGKDPGSSASRNLSNSGRSAEKKDKKDKKKDKDKDKKQKKLKKDKSAPPSADTPQRKVVIRDPASPTDPGLPASPSADLRAQLGSGIKEPDPSYSPQPSSPLSGEGKLARASLNGGPTLSLPDDRDSHGRPSPPHSPSSPNRTLGHARQARAGSASSTAQAPLSVADAIEKEAQASLARSAMRSPGMARAAQSATIPGPALTTTSPKNRRTPSLTRADQILPQVPSSNLHRAPSDPDIGQLHAKIEAEAREKKKQAEKDKEKEKASSTKRFSRLSVVLGQLAPGVDSSDNRLDIPDFIGSLVIQLMDAHGLKGNAEYENFVPTELSCFCVFHVGDQESRSLVASKGSAVWNEHLNVLCESGADLLTLDVFEYISVGREAIIGSASVELKHLLLGGFSDEWNEYSLRVDKDSGAIVNFRCCFKPFVGQQRDKPRDMFGFELPEKVLKLYKDVMPVKLKSDMERQRTLNRVFNWYRPKVVKDLKKYTRGGIPVAHRPEVWLVASGAKKKMEAHAGLYQKLLHENVSRISAHTIQIDKDLHRTAGNHYLYRTVEGRSALRRILVAYSWKNAGLGYCQSMNFVGAILLLFLDEEAVFWLLATIVEDLLPDYFTRYLVGSKADVQVFKEIAREKLPRLMSHFQKIDYDLSMLLQPWFLCLFTNYLPTKTLLRVIDAFVLEGSKILFRVGLAVLKMHEEQLLAAKNNEDAHNLLKDIPGMCFDPDKLMKVAFKDLGSLFNSNITGKIKVSRERHLKHFMETVKLADFRWLDGKTKFDQENLESLHQQFKAVAQTKADSSEDNSYLTLEAFEALMFGSLEDRTPTSTYIFKAFDTNRDQVVDFREFTIGLHLLTKGTPDEKIKFFFASFDDDADGYLTADQLSQLMSMQFLVLKQNDLTPSQKQLIVKNLVAKSATGKLSFAEFRAAISEVSLLEAALQLASTAGEPGQPGAHAHPHTPPAAATQQAPPPLDRGASGPAWNPSLTLSHGSNAQTERLEHAVDIAKMPSSPVTVDSSLTRSRKNSRAGDKGMRRSRSHLELNQLDAKKPSVKNEAGETVVSNPLWKRAGSVLPMQLKRDSGGGSGAPESSRISQPGRGLDRISSSGIKSTDDALFSPRLSPRGSSTAMEMMDKRATARGAMLGKTKSEAKDNKVGKQMPRDFPFEPLASLDHLTIDLSHLSRDARLRASRDLFGVGAKQVGAQPPVSVAVSTGTASSGLRTSDKALAQSAAEALRTSKGLRNSDSALHASVRNLASVVAGNGKEEGPLLRTSRSSEDLRKAVLETGFVTVTPPAGHPVAAFTSGTEDGGGSGSGGGSLNNSANKVQKYEANAGTPPSKSTVPDLATSASVEMPPSRPQQRDSPPIHIAPATTGLAPSTSSRTSRSGSDVLATPPRLQEVSSSGSSPVSSGQSSPHSPPPPSNLHQRRASAGSPAMRVTVKMAPLGEEQQGTSTSIGRDSSGELKLTKKKSSGKS